MMKLFDDYGRIKYARILKITLVISLFVVLIAKYFDHQATLANAAIIDVVITLFFVILEFIFAIYISFKGLKQQFKKFIKELIAFFKPDIKIETNLNYDFFIKNHNLVQNKLYRKLHVIRC